MASRADLVDLVDRQVELVGDLLRAGPRPRSALSLRSVRRILLSFSTTWTGMRIVRALSASARATACRIHQVAYVENLNLAVVELLRRTHQPDRPFLDQIEERQPLVAVPLRDRDDEAEVRLHHLLLRAVVSALDPLRQLDLLSGGEQVDLADVLQEELQRLGRDLTLVDLGLFLGRFDDLDSSSSACRAARRPLCRSSSSSSTATASPSMRAAGLLGARDQRLEDPLRRSWCCLSRSSPCSTGSPLVSGWCLTWSDMAPSKGPPVPP